MHSFTDLPLAETFKFTDSVVILVNGEVGHAVKVCITHDESIMQICKHRHFLAFDHLIGFVFSTPSAASFVMVMPKILQEISSAAHHPDSDEDKN